MRTIEDRFFSKTKRATEVRPGMTTPCLEWQAGRNSDGYGNFCLDGKMEKAHRVAWFLAHGRWPVPCGLHKCDNRRCVREEHLFEGTDADNVADMIAKGRGIQPRGDQHWSRLHPERRACGDRNGMRTCPGIKRGERNGRALVTEVDVCRIRQLRAEGWQQKKLANEFRVSRQTIGYICSGKTWAHVVETTACR